MGMLWVVSLLVVLVPVVHFLVVVTAMYPVAGRLMWLLLVSFGFVLLVCWMCGRGPFARAGDK